MTPGDIFLPLIEEIEELSVANTRGVMIDSFIVGFVLYEKDALGLLSKEDNEMVRPVRSNASSFFGLFGSCARWLHVMCKDSHSLGSRMLQILLESYTAARDV